MADPVRTNEKAAESREKAPASAMPSERQIDSPNALTLALLGAIFVVTATTWGAARFACNMHPPESRPAPKLPTERLIQTPKDAAIEFIQRFRSSDYDGALEASTGDLQQEIQRLKADCDAKANECARSREAAAGRLTTAVLLRQDASRADADVTTMLKGQTEKYRVVVAHEGAVWKAVSKTPE